MITRQSAEPYKAGLSLNEPISTYCYGLFMSHWG